MAKIKELLTRVEVRVALAQGIDVQIHAEERLIEIIRHKYNVLFDQCWWDDYLTLETFTLQPNTGLIAGDVSNKIRRFIDIHSAFLNKNGWPLPFLNRSVNPNNINVPSIAPYAVDPTKCFVLLPKTVSGEIHVWYRTVLADSVWTDGEYETDVPMDSEMLILGSCYDFMVDDGTNQQAAEKFKAMFDSRYEQLANLKHQHSLSKSGDSTNVLTNWQEEWH